MNSFPKIVSLFSAISVSVILVLACSRHQEPTVEDQLQKVQRKIDERNYAEAESEVRAILAAQPDNERARVILASIFVHKAGIMLNEYFLLERIVHETEKPTETPIPLGAWEKVKVPPGSDLEKAYRFLKEMSEVARQAQMLARQFQKIPLVDHGDADHLRMALIELDQLKNPQDGHAFYRGVVRLFYFRYLWENGYFFSFGEKQFCSSTIQEVTDRLREFGFFVSQMIGDIGRGFPKEQPKFDHVVAEIKPHLDRLDQFLRGLPAPTKTVESALILLAGPEKKDFLKCEF